MAQEDGSRNTMALLAVPIANIGVNSLQKVYHCVPALGNQQLLDHHLAVMGPIMILVGVLTM